MSAMEDQGAGRNFYKEMRNESLAAIKEKRALPTPEFAIEEGRQIQRRLSLEIAKLDVQQLDSILHGLHLIRDAWSDRNAEVLNELKTPWTLKDKSVPFALGFVGGYLLYGFDAGLMGGGAAAYLAELWKSRNLGKRSELILERVKRAERLIARAKERKEALGKGRSR